MQAMVWCRAGIDARSGKGFDDLEIPYPWKTFRVFWRFRSSVGFVTEARSEMNSIDAAVRNRDAVYNFGM